MKYIMFPKITIQKCIKISNSLSRFTAKFYIISHVATISKYFTDKVVPYVSHLQTPRLPSFVFQKLFLVHFIYKKIINIHNKLHILKNIRRTSI